MIVFQQGKQLEVISTHITRSGFCTLDLEKYITVEFWECDGFQSALESDTRYRYQPSHDAILELSGLWFVQISLAEVIVKRAVRVTDSPPPEQENLALQVGSWHWVRVIYPKEKLNPVGNHKN